MRSRLPAHQHARLSPSTPVSLSVNPPGVCRVGEQTAPKVPTAQFSRSHPRTPTRTRSHTHTHLHAPACTLAHTLAHTGMPPLTHAPSRTHPLTHTHTLSHTHTLTHTHTHTLRARVITLIRTLTRPRYAPEPSAWLPGALGRDPDHSAPDTGAGPLRGAPLVTRSENRVSSWSQCTFAGTGQAPGQCEHAGRPWPARAPAGLTGTSSRSQRTARVPGRLGPAATP